MSNFMRDITDDQQLMLADYAKRNGADEMFFVGSGGGERHASMYYFKGNDTFRVYLTDTPIPETACFRVITVMSEQVADDATPLWAA